VANTHKENLVFWEVIQPMLDWKGSSAMLASWNILDTVKGVKLDEVMSITPSGNARYFLIHNHFLFQCG
jgi:hypothetical protein